MAALIKSVVFVSLIGAGAFAQYYFDTPEGADVIYALPAAAFAVWALGESKGAFVGVAIFLLLAGAAVMLINQLNLPIPVQLLAKLASLYLLMVLVRWSYQKIKNHGGLAAISG